MGIEVEIRVKGTGQIIETALPDDCKTLSLWHSAPDNIVHAYAVYPNWQIRAQKDTIYPDYVDACASMAGAHIVLPNGRDATIKEVRTTQDYVTDLYVCIEFPGWAEPGMWGSTAKIIAYGYWAGDSDFNSRVIAANQYHCMPFGLSELEPLINNIRDRVLTA